MMPSLIQSLTESFYSTPGIHSKFKAYSVAYWTWNTLFGIDLQTFSKLRNLLEVIKGSIRLPFRGSSISLDKHSLARITVHAEKKIARMLPSSTWPLEVCICIFRLVLRRRADRRVCTAKRSASSTSTR